MAHSSAERQPLLASIQEDETDVDSAPRPTRAPRPRPRQHPRGGGVHGNTPSSSSSRTDRPRRRNVREMMPLYLAFGVIGLASVAIGVSFPRLSELQAAQRRNVELLGQLGRVADQHDGIIRDAVKCTRISDERMAAMISWVDNVETLLERLVAANATFAAQRAAATSATAALEAAATAAVTGADHHTHPRSKQLSCLGPQPRASDCPPTHLLAGWAGEEITCCSLRLMSIDEAEESPVDHMFLEGVVCVP